MARAGESLSILHSNLGTALGVRYGQGGDIEVLDEAVACHRRALDAAPPGHFDRPRCLMSLATALQTRFEAVGELPWLNEAVTLFRQALHAVDGLKGHPHYARSLCGLGGALVLRYQHIGDSDSLHEALWRFDEGVRVTPAGHVNLPMRLSSKSAAYYHAFQSNPGQYEQITRPVREAISLASPTHVQRGYYLSNLGAYLTTYYELTDDEAALDEAISRHEQAVTATPADDPERGKRLSNWALSLAHRARRTQDPDDAERAVAACASALEAMPAPNPHRAQCLQGHAEILTLRAQFTADTDDHARARAAYQEAVQDPIAPTLVRIRAAHQLGDAAAEAGDIPAALDAFTRAVSLVGQTAWHLLDQEAQTETLQRLAHLPQDAAAMAITSGNLPLAVELLEEGRGVLLAHTLDDTSYQHVHARAPELAERLGEISAALAHMPQPVSGLPEERNYSPAHHPSSMDRRIALATEHEALVGQIRQIPGLDDFMRPPRYADLQEAGAHGPVVIVNISSYRCDAIALTPHGTHLIPLPGLTHEAAAAYADSLRKAVRTAQSPAREADGAHATITTTMTRIWQTVTEPILKALGITGPSDPAGGGPRMWWCPTGPAAALPLHATGRPPHADHHDTALDRVTSSYTPTVRALQRLRDRPGPDVLADPRPLIVAMPATPARADLPGSRAETDHLTRRCGKPHVLAGQTATVGAVTEAMRQHAWTHFSCHGERAPHTHDGGRLLLHDDSLTARQIAGLNIPDAAFAYVSACATYSSTGDLDDCLSIGSALQLAGYRHVIATLWPVYDLSTADLSRAVYDRLLDTPGHTLHVADSATALRAAMLDARCQAPDDPTRWAPYLHLGPQ